MLKRLLILTIMSIASACVGGTIENTNSKMAIGNRKLATFVAEYKRPYTTCTIELIEHPQHLQNTTSDLGKKSFWTTIGKVSHFMKFGYAYQMEVQDESGNVLIANFKKELIFRPDKEILLDYENKTAHVNDRTAESPIRVSGEFAADIMRYANGVEPILARIAKINTITTETQGHTLSLIAPIPAARDKNATTVLTFVFDLDTTNSLLNEYRVGTETGQGSGYFEGIWHFMDWSNNSGRLRPQKLAFETNFYDKEPMNSTVKPSRSARRDFTITYMAYDSPADDDEVWNIPVGFQVIKQ